MPQGKEGELTDEQLAKLAEEQAQTQGEEVITVTGSLIDRREVDTASPISVVDRQKLAAAGITNVGDILQKLPSQGNALNDQNNNGGDGSVRINLRSLGDNRTLILLNGRRVVPSGLGADASVDLGTIPLAMIDRVEVLKDGASALYGSDAIAGVVNIITRQDFEGTDATIYTGTSQRGDGTNYDLSFVNGHSSKRGNITFSAGYQHQDQVLAKDRPPWADRIYAYDFAGQLGGTCGRPGMPSCATLSGSSATPTGYLDTDPLGMGSMDPNAITVPGCSNSIPSGNPPMGGNCTYDPTTGKWRNFIDATPTSFGDKYNFQPQNYLFTPSSRINLFSNGHYDITKNVRAFFEAQYNDRKSEQQLAPEPLFLAQYNLVISQNNVFNPFGTFGPYGSMQGNGMGVDILDYNRRLNEFGNRTYKQDVQTGRIVVGLEGKVDEDAPAFKNWKWELSYNYGRVDASQQTYGDLIVSHLQNALGPSMYDNSGNAVCVTTPGDLTTVIPNCVPLNILTPGSVTPAMIKYLTFTGIQYGFNEQHTALAQAHGKIVDLPNHGDISFAIGGDYRHEQGGVQPDPLTSTGDTTGNAQAPTEGSYHLFEGFAEASIVPVAHVTGAEFVEFDLAGRAYDYNTFGSGVTGKFAGLWRPVQQVAVRGTYGNAFRAPNVAELYSGLTDNYVQINDPCDHNPPSGPVMIDPNSTLGQKCAQQIGATAGTYVGNGAPQQRFKNGGSTALTPEKAKIGTAGIVVEPKKGFALTADYWHIDITNAIETLPPQTVFSNCYSAGLDSYCNLIQRDPATHTIQTVFDTIRNIGGTKTSGVDFGASYTNHMPDLGTLRASFEGTYMMKYDQDTGQIDPKTGKDVIIHGRNYYDLGVLPDTRLFLFTTFEHKSGFGAGVNARFVGNFKECDQDNCQDPTNGVRNVGAYATGDLFLNYSMKSKAGQTRIAVGVNNFTDAQPRIIYNGAALNTDESAYDFMGRFFYVRLSQLF